MANITPAWAVQWRLALSASSNFQNPKRFFVLDALRVCPFDNPARIDALGIVRQCPPLRSRMRSSWKLSYHVRLRSLRRRPVTPLTRPLRCHGDPPLSSSSALQAISIPEKASVARHPDGSAGPLLLRLAPCLRLLPMPIVAVGADADGTDLNPDQRWHLDFGLRQ
jgi:hypothetical protein